MRKNYKKVWLKDTVSDNISERGGGIETEKMDNKGCWEKGKEMRIHA